MFLLKCWQRTRHHRLLPRSWSSEDASRGLCCCIISLRVQCTPSERQKQELIQKLTHRAILLLSISKRSILWACSEEQSKPNDKPTVTYVPHTYILSHSRHRAGQEDNKPSFPTSCFPLFCKAPGPVATAMTLQPKMPAQDLGVAGLNRVSQDAFHHHHLVVCKLHNGSLTKNDKKCLWVAVKRRLCPPSAAEPF